MNALESRKHYSLNAKQRHLLILLYKFRFATIPLLTAYKKLKSNSLQRTFDILLEEGYVNRRFDATYKIDRKPAVYSLSAKGIAVLRDDPHCHPSVLHSYYKNKSVGDVFVQHIVDTFRVYNLLKYAYGEYYEVFTRQEIAHFDDFPENMPDLYLRGQKEYFVVVAHDIQPFLARKQLREYVMHFEEEGWVRDDYPTLIFIFADELNRRRFREYANALLESAGIGDDELYIGATTMAICNLE